MRPVQVAIRSIETNELLTDRGRPFTWWERFGPLGAVALAVIFGLIGLQSETTDVPTLNDSSIHEEMVRFADQLLRAHHLPLDSWFPFLGLGSPQFLHYQSGGVLLTVLLGLIVGSNNAFNWVLYLLLVSWPISIYWAARTFNWGRWPSAGAALVSPLLISAIGVGYEQQSYIFSGYGVWTQLWGMWTLPLAWAFSWRAVSQRRYLLPAALFIALTAAFHFLTGYLAFAPIVVWVLLKPNEIVRRIARGALVAIGAFLVAGWVIIPLVVEGKWASINELLQHSSYSDSYGAKQVLSWLFTGGIFDYGRFPIVSLFVLVGFITCVVCFRTDERSRAILGVFVLSILLFFGRSTLGPLVDLLPGSHDLFLRRFIIGVQLAGIILAGVGIATTVDVLRRFATRIARWDRSNLYLHLQRGVICALVLLVLTPAWSQIASNDTANANDISLQQSGDVTQGAQLNQLINKINSVGGGRVYAGLDAPSNWGQNFIVGDVPVFKYLASKDVDEVGYTLRTASLMTIPEAYFDESNPSDYTLFAVRFLILPPNRPPSVPAKLILRSGPYLLWEVNSGGFVQLVNTFGSITANRTDLGSQTSPFVDSDEPGDLVYPTIVYAGAMPAPATIANFSQRVQTLGSVTSEKVNLKQGYAQAEVSAHRDGVVILKASFDPGWTVTVDNVPARTEMVAPAYVGVRISAGTHDVVFRYVGYPDYPLLFAIVLVPIVALGVISHRWKKHLTA